MRIVIILAILTLTMTNCGNNKIQHSQQSSLEAFWQENFKDSVLVTGWYYLVTDGGYIRQLEKTDEIYILDPLPIITAEDIIELNVSEDRWKQAMLVMRFGERGTQAWSIATQKTIGGKLAFVLNDKLLYISQVNSQITTGVSAFNRAGYIKDEIEEIKQAIEINRQAKKKVE